MSARQEKVREALTGAKDGRIWGARYDAALAEVEEWETKREADLVLLARQEDENRRLWNRANAAEAERDEARRTRDDLLAAEDMMLHRVVAAEAEADRLKATLEALVSVLEDRNDQPWGSLDTLAGGTSRPADTLFPNPNLVTAEDEKAIKAAGAPYRCCQHWPECSHVEAWANRAPADRNTT